MKQDVQLIQNLKKLNDDTLLNQVSKLVQKERELNVKVIHYIWEIKVRRLYAKRGYSSLFEFLIKGLHYSKGAAHRRLESMSLIQVVPEAKESLREGKVNLTTASTLNSFFNRQEKMARSGELTESDRLKTGTGAVNIGSRGKTVQENLFDEGINDKGNSDGNQTLPTGKDSESSAQGLNQDPGKSSPKETEKPVIKVPTDRPFSTQEKEFLFKQIEGKSKNETEKMIADLMPQKSRQEKVRRVNGQDVEIRFTADPELIKIFNRIKELKGHQFSPGNYYQEMFKWMGKFVLDRIDPLRKKVKKPKAKLKKAESKKKVSKIQDKDGNGIGNKIQNRNENEGKLQARGSLENLEQSFVEKNQTSSLENLDPNSSPENQSSVGFQEPNPGSLENLVPQNQNESENQTKNLNNSRYIPVYIKNIVWIRDCGQCTYVDPTTGRRCEARSGLHLDHLLPHAAGGKSDNPNNLRLLCPSHNTLEAIKFFGEEKMEKYLGKKMAKL